MRADTKDANEALEYIRGEIQAERISMGEIAYLQSDLLPYIDDDDVELLEWAGVPEHPVIDWTDISSKRDGHYLSGEYEGIYCELFLNDRLGHATMAWDWSFYDDKSYDPELAVARSEDGFLSLRAATMNLTDYIDGYIWERDNGHRP